jgi:glycosyltransferase involved in cell wall biosynthesis
MKITHICLCGPVTDNWSYQDNLLPKFHKRLGYDVSVIASKYVWNNEGRIVRDERDVYLNEYGIKTIRIESKFGTNINSKLKTYKKLLEYINEESPDILFIHGIQFLNIIDIVKYLKKNTEVEVYVDNHADFSNSATNWISKNILHRFIWRSMGKLIEPYVKKFYGVLPARVDFLINMYKIPKEKVDLLVMGADDDKVKEAWNDSLRSRIREKYNVDETDFLIITGGKIDSSKKQTILLMEAIRKIGNDKIKLLIFGSVSSELQEKVNELSDGKYVNFIGWIDPNDSYKYFSSADLAIFPGRHSVFWEQVVGIGVPIVAKYWKGTTHIDVGGNCKLLYEDSSNEIENIIKEIVNNKNTYENMLDVAKTKGVEEFLYSKIASRSLGL